MIRLLPLQARFPRSVGGARDRALLREGIVVAVDRADGSIGYGEASPLPGFSRESLVEARADLERAIATDTPPGLPSARFALETALWGHLPTRQHAGITSFIGDPARAQRWADASRSDPIAGGRQVGACPLVDVLEGGVELGVSLVSLGARALKVKIGRAGLEKEEAQMLRSLRAAVGDRVELRADANGMLAATSTLPALLGELGFSLLEDPCALAELGPLPVPIALDQSASRDPEGALAAIRAGLACALVIKPSLVGGLAASAALAARARELGARVIFSHLLDGPIALAASAHLALALGAEGELHGLAPWVGLGCFEIDGMPIEPPPFVGVADITMPSEPGLGVRVVEPLSIHAAARERPNDVALVVASASETRELSFAELDAALRASPRSPRAIVGEPTLRGALEVLGAIDRREPFHAIHPRWSEPERARVLEQAATPPPSTLAVVYTSGTSGTRRGAILSRRAFVSSARASHALLPLEPSDRWLLAMPLAHVGGLSILTRCLVARAAPVLLEGAFDARRALDLLASAHVTLVSLVPTMLARLLDEGFAPTPSLRAVLLGGARCPPAILERALAARIPVRTTYGLTEACSQVATTPRAIATPGDALHARLLPGIEARIGSRGTLLVRGPTLLEGWIDGSPATGEDGFYDTGDLAILEGDELRVIGRADDVIITGGENVSPAIVERALEALPGIREACVYGRADPAWGERVEAAIVTTEDAPDDHAILEALRATLAPFERPRRLVRLASLPLGATGKPDRRALARGEG